MPEDNLNNAVYMRQLFHFSKAQWGDLEFTWS